ncbi:MAG: nucleotidyltransferase family protein [Wenzhouxiangella sp.]|nr:nucleotidyltransferase family protein [Wenzhouxiangella sp.]
MSGEPRVSPDIRLLLLMSRLRLDAAQQDHALKLCAEIADWGEFALRAGRHFIAPLCLRHLRALPAFSAQETACQALVQVIRPMTLHSLKLAALQRNFVQTQLKPLEVPFLAVKGRALATRYYGDAGLRYCRDIDILVPRRRLVDVIEQAQQAGYRVYPDMVEISRGEARVLASQARVVALLGPENIFIEVHAQLDKTGFLLDHVAMTARADSIELDGITTPVLATTDCFIYICLHHTKHFWSRLNWLADLDAIVQADDFDRATVMSEASRLGVDATVAACLCLHEACGQPDPFAWPGLTEPARDLLQASLANLEGGCEVEFEQRKGRLSLEFNFDWQFPPGYRRRDFWYNFKSFFKPTLSDYQLLPLPESMYWMYYGLRPFLLLARRVLPDREHARTA